jgi:predicted acyltransferase
MPENQTAPRLIRHKIRFSRSPKRRVPGARLLSLDCFRGFLLWNAFLMEPLVTALRQVPASDLRDRLIEQCTHADWNALHYIDAGFPGYIILVGASMTLSFQRRTQAGATKRQLLRHAFRRSILLWIFSFFFEGGFSVPFQQMAFTDIFYQLSVYILATALLLVGLPRRWQVVALAAFLLAHWAALTLIPVPGHGLGDFSKDGNVESYFRSTGATLIAQAFGLSAPYYKFAEAMMWYATLPKAVGTCLIGLILGQILGSDISHQRRSSLLAAFGSAAMLAAWIWNGWLPINKHLWTPSFTLFTGGFIFVLFAAMIQIVEIWNCRRFAFVLTIFGCNSLLAWACFFRLPFDDFANRLVGPGFPSIFGPYQPLMIAITQVTLCWSLVAWLHLRQRGR